MKTKTPQFRDIVLGDLKRYKVPQKELAAEMGLSVSRMYAVLNEPMNIRAQGIIAIQKLTKLPYSEIMLMIQQAS
jgi:hypothetical protein